MVRTVKWDEITIYFAASRKLATNDRNRVTALAYFPIMLAVKYVFLMEWKSNCEL